MTDRKLLGTTDAKSAAARCRCGSRCVIRSPPPNRESPALQIWLRPCVVHMRAACPAADITMQAQAACYVYCLTCSNRPAYMQVHGCVPSTTLKRM
jgi:hypothetical protein